jgi:hypothetical protein
VQNVTESRCNLLFGSSDYYPLTYYVIVMSVLRMIKLFGWEGRVKESIGEKRDEELKWVWKRKLLGVFNDVAKYAVRILCSHCVLSARDSLAILFLSCISW